MRTQECKKCLKVVSIDNFREFIAVTKEAKVRRRRKVCYACCYMNQKRRAFSWKTATDEEKLQRLEDNFNHFAVKKNGCWDWKGFIRPDGYTRMKFMQRDKSIGAHVASWMIHNKKLSTHGLYVLHKCDNRKCTNPEHLFLGNSRDNMIDMLQKKRSVVAKLLPEEVKVIKQLLVLGLSVNNVAKRFHVNWKTIDDIKKNKTWKHVE